VKVVENCAAVEKLTKDQVTTREHPEWLNKSRVPVLIGGYIAFAVAYCLGLYTVWHMARAYKRLEVQARSLSLAQETCNCALQI
jgi:hypothetical protein